MGGRTAVLEGAAAPGLHVHFGVPRGGREGAQAPLAPLHLCSRTTVLRYSLKVMRHACMPSVLCGAVSLQAESSVTTSCPVATRSLLAPRIELAYPCCCLHVVTGVRSHLP